jgi:hypothetical protein
MNTIVGHFPDPKNNKVTIGIIARENESSSDAIKRVATDHGIDPSSVAAGEPPKKGLNPVTELATKLLTAAEDGDVTQALILARTIASELERDLKIGNPQPQHDGESFEQATGRSGAMRAYLDRLQPTREPAENAQLEPSSAYDYGKLFPQAGPVV